MRKRGKKALLVALNNVRRGGYGMIRNNGKSSFFVVFAVVSLLVTLTASASLSDKKLAIAIADYLVAGRAVIAVNQAVINDPSKGERRFTPEVYERHVQKEFLRSTGIDIKDLAGSKGGRYETSLRVLHESALNVIDMFQIRINRPGKGFKGVNPAMYGIWVGKEFSKRSGIVLKQTSLRYRATYNKPDAFEAKILKMLESSDQAMSHYEETEDSGKKYARYLVPLYITEPCLVCHGEPAGTLDMTGRTKEGYKLGDLRGGISVMVPIL